MEHKEHDEPRWARRKLHLRCVYCAFVFPQRQRARKEWLQNFVAEMRFVDIGKTTLSLSAWWESTKRFPQRHGAHKEKASEFRCGNGFRRHCRKKLCGLRVLRGNQRSLSRKGTEHTKKKPQNPVAETVFVDIAKKTLWPSSASWESTKRFPQRHRAPKE
jgi:hypothetical protein